MMKAHHESIGSEEVLVWSALPRGSCKFSMRLMLKSRNWQDGGTVECLVDRLHKGDLGLVCDSE